MVKNPMLKKLVCINTSRYSRVFNMVVLNDYSTIGKGRNGTGVKMNLYRLRSPRGLHDGGSVQRQPSRNLWSLC